MSSADKKTYESIQIALVSPSDVGEERKLAKEVIDDINTHFAMPLGMFIELRQWEDAYPALHPLGPQGHIDSQLKIPECDLVVGIFWKLLGTPAISGQTGAEHEIQTAYDAWAEHGKPQVMLYFNKHPIKSEDIDQALKVRDFKKQFRDKALFREYDGPDMFAGDFRNHLTRLIADRANAGGSTIAVVPCFASASPGYVRAIGMADLVAEIALLFAATPGAKPTTCNVMVTLNTSIDNTIGEKGLLVDVFLSTKDKDAGTITRFRGRLVTLNQVQFDNVVLDLAGPVGTREYSITGLRANILRLGGSVVQDTHVTAWVHVVGSTEWRMIHVVNPVVSVGVLKHAPYFFMLPEPVATFSRKTGVNSGFAVRQTGILPEVSCRVRFQEPFFGYFTNATEESRYRYEAELTAPPTGTRLLVRFSQLPGNIQLWVTTRNIDEPPLDLEFGTTNPSAVLVRTNDLGAGPAEPIQPDNTSSEGYPIARIDIVDGVAQATWEWFRAKPKLSMKLPRWVQFGVVVVAASNEAYVGEAIAQGSLAPLGYSFSHGVSSINSSPDAPVPRFANVHGPVPAVRFTDD